MHGLVAFGAFVLIAASCDTSNNAPANDGAANDAAIANDASIADAAPTDASAGDASPVDFTKLTPSCFVANASNPVIKQNDFFTGATWNDPHVFKSGPQYIMYASADHSFDKDVQIYRLVSSDGIAWTPSPASFVFQKSADASAWDSQAVETPAVVQFNGTYYLFYTGYSDQTNIASYKVGCATSADGITFARQASYVVAPTAPDAGAPNSDFDQYIVAEPGPVVFNGKIYLYFTAIGLDATLSADVQSIGVVTSSDGVHWSAPQEVVRPDQTLYPVADWAGYSTPNAIVMDGKVHLFFDVAHANPWTQTKIHHAVSADGLTFTQDSAAIFDKSQFAWTSAEIRSPTEYLDGTQLKMWFAGDKDALSLGIGVSSCNLAK